MSQMSQRTVSALILPIIVFLVAVAIMAPSPVAAQSACAVDVEHGVLCDGPRVIQASFLPLIQSSQNSPIDRECPDPVGNGVLCDGPVIPDNQPAPAPQSIGAPATIPQLYLPLLSS